MTSSISKVGNAVSWFFSPSQAFAEPSNSIPPLERAAKNLTNDINKAISIAKEKKIFYNYNFFSVNNISNDFFDLNTGQLTEKGWEGLVFFARNTGNTGNLKSFFKLVIDDFLAAIFPKGNANGIVGDSANEKLICLIAMLDLKDFYKGDKRNFFYSYKNNPINSREFERDFFPDKTYNEIKVTKFALEVLRRYIIVNESHLYGEYAHDPAFSTMVSTRGTSTYFGYVSGSDKFYSYMFNNANIDPPFLNDQNTKNYPSKSLAVNCLYALLRTADSLGNDSLDEFLYINPSRYQK